MKKRSAKLQTKITVFIIIILSVSIFLLTIHMVDWTQTNIQQKAETNILNIASIIADTPMVAAYLENHDISLVIQHYVETVLKSVKGIEIVVVADMKGTRYAHPDSSKIGKKFVGGDEARVIKNGETYISEATGTLGKALRAFTPVYNEQRMQVGFVMVGELTRNIYGAKKAGIINVVESSLLSLVVGILGAFLLARNIKRTLLGYEPDEITKLFTEKQVLINSIHEGIVAIDDKKKITLINDSAIKILKITSKNIIGKDITKLIPNSNLPGVINSGISMYDKEHIINGTHIISNLVAIKDSDKITGALATFRDKTAVTIMAEEITGVRQIIDALRANTHEFMNKLHVILGLIQLGEVEEAKNIIIRVKDEQQQILSMVLNKIKDATIAGLVLGKLSRAKELGVTMIIEEESQLEKREDSLQTEALITIIGNLLENAIEAAAKNNHVNKKVFFRIKDTRRYIKVRVKDTGIGIQKEHIERIFERGYTTKQGSQGVGLSLVKQTVENLSGRIKVFSELNRGTVILVVLPKLPYSKNTLLAKGD